MRISKETKAIADRHIEAKRLGKFDNPKVNTKPEVITELKNGRTFEEVLKQIEARFCSMTSLVIGAMGHETKSYKRQVYHGFKTLLQ